MTNFEDGVTTSVGSADIRHTVRVDRRQR